MRGGVHSVIILWPEAGESLALRGLAVAASWQCVCVRGDVGMG